MWTSEQFKHMTTLIRISVLKYYYSLWSNFILNTAILNL
jgi:hypothetical protein